MSEESLKAARKWVTETYHVPEDKLDGYLACLVTEMAEFLDWYLDQVAEGKL